MSGRETRDDPALATLSLEIESGLQPVATIIVTSIFLLPLPEL
jgi:hypothetical protein